MPGLALISERRKGNLISRKATVLQGRFGPKQKRGRTRGRLACLKVSPTRPPARPHTLGFQVGGRHPGRCHIAPRGLVNATELRGPCRRSGGGRGRAAGRGGCRCAVAALPAATYGRQDLGGEAVGVRGRAPRKP